MKCDMNQVVTWVSQEEEARRGVAFDPVENYEIEKRISLRKRIKDFSKRCLRGMELLLTKEDKRR